MLRMLFKFFHLYLGLNFFQFPLFSEYCDVYIGLGEYVRKTTHGKIIVVVSLLC